VVKSNALMPPALGVTMGDNGNDYDDSPPAAAAAERGRPSHLKEDCDWLRGQLLGGPKAVGNTRNLAEAAGIGSTRLYAAKRELKVQENGPKGNMWWSLTTDQKPGEG